jgi:hypothetical protein
MSSQYAGKVLSKTPGDEAGRHNYQCLFPSHVHTVCAPAHSKFSHTLRHFIPNFNSSRVVEVGLVEVEVALVGIDVGLGDAAINPAVT